MITLTILVPIFAGIFLLCIPKWKRRSFHLGYVAFFLLLTAGLVTASLITAGDVPIVVGQLNEELFILFRVDRLGRFFAGITSIVWVLAGLFSFSYMSHEQNEKRYYGFYLLVYGILLGLDFSGNLVTFYLFYELLTLTSMPLVLHSGTKEAIMAGIKYLLFSFAGAYMALFGLYFVNHYAGTLVFTPGGVLSATLDERTGGILLITAFVMLLGFGVKAGMFPLHAWLPTAHPVAPAPASAALSGIIVKAGVLGCIRTVYEIFGTDFLKDTWVQQVWLILILLTILIGSAMAFREKGLKKRLAYSTVSQVSYILFGLALFNTDGITGALIHVSAHALTKSGLFLIAGAIIFLTGKTRVEELKGVGKQMPVIMGCFVLLSLSLIGIPPFAGFVSKWYLGLGSIAETAPGLGVVGMAVLMVSALLTAGYLLPIAINAFLPGKTEVMPSDQRTVKVPISMEITVVILTLSVTLLGMFPTWFLEFLRNITNVILKEVAG